MAGKYRCEPREAGWWQMWRPPVVPPAARRLPAGRAPHLPPAATRQAGWGIGHKQPNTPQAGRQARPRLLLLLAAPPPAPPTPVVGAAAARCCHSGRALPVAPLAGRACSGLQWAPVGCRACLRQQPPAARCASVHSAWGPTGAAGPPPPAAAAAEGRRLCAAPAAPCTTSLHLVQPAPLTTTAPAPLLQHVATPRLPLAANLASLLLRQRSMLPSLQWLPCTSCQLQRPPPPPPRTPHTPPHHRCSTQRRWQWRIPLPRLPQRHRARAPALPRALPHLLPHAGGCRRMLHLLRLLGALPQHSPGALPQHLPPAPAAPHLQPRRSPSPRLPSQPLPAVEAGWPPAAAAVGQLPCGGGRGGRSAAA